MFEFLFKYPAAAFSKGEILLMGRWPVWLLVVLALIAVAALAFPLWRKAHPARVRPAIVWCLQASLVVLLLVLLWQPALSVPTLRAQQNIVAVIVDDSRSMNLADAAGSPRIDQATRALNNGVLSELEKKFQVRLYRAGSSVERIPNTKSVRAEATATRIGDALKQVVGEAASLPIGAVVLLSDGADNAGGIDLPTISEIRRYRIPVHTVGFGRERPERDIEVDDAQMPLRALADSRLQAHVTLRQFGYEGRRARINLRDGNKVVASREVVLKGDGVEQTEALAFNAGAAGAKSYQVSVDLLDGEENRLNNSLTRLVNVEGTKPRVLYIEGEPKWEFKFLRRAIDLDQGLQLVSMLRTTQNKTYRQGIGQPSELEQGFPATVEELFGYQGIVIGGVEANYFTPKQQELIRQFVDRRGGGILFLGGRGGLADGGWGTSPLTDLLPVLLPNRKDSFRREVANVELTSAGRDSLACRLEDDPQRNVERWKKLPYVMNHQDIGVAKPGAVVLADLLAGNKRSPLLVTQNYGRGRTAIFATAGSWRWQMSQPVEDQSHEMFWQQLLRWVVSGTTGPVISSSPKSVFADEVKIPLRAEVRDKNYNPASDARVEATILGPEGGSEKVELKPDPVIPGIYTADWAAAKPGAYVVETVATRGGEEAGRDVMSFRREDGVAENFRTYQNRELLEKVSQQTGGRYFKPDEMPKLASEISYSEAGISVRETRDLWNMPVIFLVALALRSSEWLLRRKWGVV